MNQNIPFHLALFVEQHLACLLLDIGPPGSFPT